MSLPDEITKILKEIFKFPEKILIGCVATSDKESPNVRMMRIYDILPAGELILLTSTSSKKWEEWQLNSLTAICMTSQDFSYQIICKGKAFLYSSNEPIATRYWGAMRIDVRDTYPQADNAISENFGIIKFLPYYWEQLTLKIPHKDSIRQKFHLKNNIWVNTSINL